MPQLWMYAGTEAVKMATEDRFDITEWFKLIKDREVACKSNDEMTDKVNLPVTANPDPEIQTSTETSTGDESSPILHLS